MRNSILILFSVLFFPFSLFCQQNEPIIDVHLHAYDLWRTQSDTAWYPSGFNRPTSSEELMRQSFKMMNKYHIDKAIISGDTKTIQKWQAENPGRLIPGYETWEPFTPEHIARLAQKIKSGEVKVLAEIVTQYDGKGASDSALEPLYALAEENDIPVGIHVGP
jgi:predicted TIM-barrel fold metal-dependent hydrolase